MLCVQRSHPNTLRDESWSSSDKNGSGHWSSDLCSGVLPPSQRYVRRQRLQYSFSSWVNIALWLLIKLILHHSQIDEELWLAPTESCELPTPRTWRGLCWRTLFHLWVEDFSLIVILIDHTHSPVCITIPTKADVMMYIDSIKCIIVDEFYRSRISRVFILIIVYSELLSWSSQLFENVVEFCWYWSFITNMPVLSSIACWNVPHNIYCLIGLAMDCHVITT